MSKNIDTFDENEFDDALFQKANGLRKEEEIEEKAQDKKKWIGHIIFFAIVICLFIFAIVRIVLWNKGGVDSGYDPNEDTSEFDTEPLDYIQPLNSAQLEGKPDDGVTTIFCFGNSTFADNGDKNQLAKAIGARYDATVINCGFPNSYQSVKFVEEGNEFSENGLSLYHVTNALVNSDFTEVDKAAADSSDEVKAKADYLKTVDFSTADMVVIMYDLSDYVDHRPVYDPGDTDNLLTYAGALEASVKLIQEKYPYIRIVVLSTPACGKTIDDFYVDGDIHDLGNGTLTDYMGYEAQVATSCGISFIDTYFGVINVDNRDEYLVDDYHLNEAGCNAIADRMKKLIILNN